MIHKYIFYSIAYIVQFVNAFVSNIILFFSFDVQDYIIKKKDITGTR